MMVLPVLTAIAGLAYLIWNMRYRRNGTEARCRRCDQIVEGITDRCPECGLILSKRLAVAKGARAPDWVLGVVAFLVLATSLAWCGVIINGAMTEPGWQSKVPGWWLSEIEMRFSNGTRLEQAAAGLLMKRDQRAISSVAFESGARSAFHKYLTERAGGRVVSPSIRAMALAAAELEAVDDQQIAEAIRASTIVSQWTTDTGAYESEWGRVECDFLPQRWQFYFMVTDDTGMYLGSDTRVGNSIELIRALISSATQNADEPTPNACVWMLRLLKDGEPPTVVREWTQTKPIGAKLRRSPFPEPPGPES